jgi:hypothetical protein
MYVYLKKRDFDIQGHDSRSFPHRLARPFQESTFLTSLPDHSLAFP